MKSSVIGVGINQGDRQDALNLLIDWAKLNLSKAVFFANVHVVVTAKSDPVFFDAINNGDLVLPDGAPIAWMMRRLYYSNQKRIDGPDFMHAVLKECASENISVYFYGGSVATQKKLIAKLKSEIPGLNIAGWASPPFRDLSQVEIDEAVAAINGSKAGLTFIGLGCPKQEKWIASQRGTVKSVMLGVGAAFDFHAGTLRRAPKWMRSIGFEWLHRLVSEPVRLWRRYLVTNTIFLILAFKQLFID